jgi:hypothetical protein
MMGTLCWMPFADAKGEKMDLTRAPQLVVAFDNAEPKPIKFNGKPEEMRTDYVSVELYDGKFSLEMEDGTKVRGLACYALTLFPLTKSERGVYKQCACCGRKPMQDRKLCRRCEGDRLSSASFDRILSGRGLNYENAEKYSENNWIKSAKQECASVRA